MSRGQVTYHAIAVGSRTRNREGSIRRLFLSFLLSFPLSLSSMFYATDSDVNFYAIPDAPGGIRSLAERH